MKSIFTVYTDWFNKQCKKVEKDPNLLRGCLKASGLGAIDGAFVAVAGAGVMVYGMVVVKLIKKIKGF